MPAGVGLSKGAVAGHIKRAAALDARRVSTRSEFVEKPVNGIMQIILSICLCPSHRHFQKKTCFLPIRTGLPACVRAR